MKTKNIIIIMTVIALIAFIPGVTGLIDLHADGTQIAENPNARDLLVGVFITTEYLDLFDMEAYLNDNIEDIIDIKTTVEPDRSYEDKVYAVLKDKSFTSEETGEIIKTSEYVFEDVEGFPFFHCTIYDENGDYGTAMSDPAISDCNFASNYTDNGEEQALEGTIYYTDKLAGDVFYTNPVYQSADGRVYLMSGYGISFTTSSTELKDEITVRTNGEEKTKKTTVKINFEEVPDAREIKITQMDSQNNRIKTDNFAPGKVPENYSPGRGTDYLIVETITSEETQRDIVDKSEDSFTTMKTREDGICQLTTTSVEW